MIEYRSVAGAVETSGRRLVGYAARYDVEADLGEYREVFHRGAFGASIAAATRPVPLLIGHRVDRVVAATPSTLRLVDGDDGVEFDADLPDTAEARDLRVLVESGVLSGMSVGFRATADQWDNTNRRTIRAAELFEVSVVAVPAYPDTSVALRNRPPPAAPSPWRYRLRIHALNGRQHA